jgi:hypothetical protein
MKLYVVCSCWRSQIFSPWYVYMCCFHVPAMFPAQYITDCMQVFLEWGCYSSNELGSLIHSIDFNVVAIL